MAHNHHDHDHNHDHSHHDHDHNHAHHHAPSQFNIAFAIATLLNSLFIIIEVFYAFSAHSMGLLADAGHNLGDVFGLVMAWIANVLLQREATAKYSYGFKKTTLLSTLANALLLAFASAIVIYESIIKLFHPLPIQEGIVMLVAFVGILINGGSALFFLRGREDDLNIKGAFLHMASDALLSLGVVISAVIIYFTGWVRLDPIVGIIIVLIIFLSAWKLLRQSIDLLLGAVPRNIDQQAVRNYLVNIEGVTAVHDLHIWSLSTQETALTAHLVLPERILTDTDYQQINHTLKHDFKINHVTIQVEKGSAADPCGQAVSC